MVVKKSVLKTKYLPGTMRRGLFRRTKLEMRRGCPVLSLGALSRSTPPGKKLPSGSSGNGSSAWLGSLKPPQGFQGVCSLSVRTRFSRGDKGLTSRILPAGRANPIRLAMSPCALCAPREPGGAAPGQGRGSGALSDTTPPPPCSSRIRVCPWPRSPERESRI